MEYTLRLLACQNACVRVWRHHTRPSLTFRIGVDGASGRSADSAAALGLWR